MTARTVQIHDTPARRHSMCRTALRFGPDHWLIRMRYGDVLKRLPRGVTLGHAVLIIAAWHRIAETRRTDATDIWCRTLGETLLLLRYMRRRRMHDDWQGVVDSVLRHGVPMAAE